APPVKESVMITARAKYLRLPFLLLLWLLLAPLPANAQFSSTIQGTVTDGQGGVMPGATVRVTNTTTGVMRDVVTSDDGMFRVFSLGAGTYRVEVELAGF